MPLDLDRAVREREDVIVAEAEALAVGLRRRNVAGSGLGASFDINHLDLFAAQRPPQHRAPSALERGLEDDEFVRVNGTLHHVLAKAVPGADQYHVAKAGLGIEGEHDAAGRKIRAHHLLHADRQVNLKLVEPLIGSIVDRAICVETREAALARIQELLFPLNVQIGLLLAGEARHGQILGGRRAAHRDTQCLAILPMELAISVQNLPLQVLGQRSRIDDLARTLPAARQVLISSIFRPSRALRSGSQAFASSST